MSSLQCMVKKKKKHLRFLLTVQATCSSHLHHTSITLSTSPFTLLAASPSYRFHCAAKYGRGRRWSGTNERKRQICCLWAEVECSGVKAERSDHCECRAVYRNSSSHQEQEAPIELLIFFLCSTQTAFWERTLVLSPDSAARAPLVPTERDSGCLTRRRVSYGS